jgi:hypothetical protein
MLVDFESLPDTSRIWIYQADRILTDSEILLIESKLKEFVSGWNSHGANLVSAFTIKNRIHVILGTNEEISSASGCSIDKSVNTIKTIANELGVDFFNRNLVFYEKNNVLEKLNFFDFKKGIKSGELIANTHFFDNTITTKIQLKHNWFVPVKESWLRNMLNLL